MIIRFLFRFLYRKPRSYHFSIDLNNGAHFDVIFSAPYAAHLMLQWGEKGVARA